MALISLSSSRSVSQAFLLFSTLAIGVFAAKVSLNQIVKATWFLIVLFVSLFAWTALLAPGVTVLARLGSLSIYLEAVDFGGALALRFLTTFIASIIFIRTTNPRDFALSLSQIFRVPYRISYAFFVALRFIPILEEEAASIRAAHMLRSPYKRTTIKQRVETAKRFIITLFVATMRRAMTMAIAMDSKAFGASSNRTYLYKVRMDVRGKLFGIFWVATAISITIMTSAFGVRL
ncbi:MAG: energy-coupling factor transporter transmembrane protein EcfT [Nitrososphaerales archaeon]|nr:energy-coupling factor transporter transmembrane protein EcfT [Nitrososphaerales archaeon]